jgi:HPt (histidine-containing phosphotransfer) domain-containing protein
MSKKQKFDDDWLKKEEAKDKVFVDNYKQQIINSIKDLKKEDIIVIKKYTLWQRIKKSLGF